jgi:glycolate oxidase FAD binding subunit
MIDLPATLATLVPPGQVISPPQFPAWLTRALAPVVPAALVYPHSEAELAAVMACAHQQGWRILPCGNGSKLDWGAPPQPVDLVISTARLNQVIDHAVGDMTLTAQAGATLGQLTAVVAAQQQDLALDSAHPHQATLGGIVATADSGSRRHRYGGVRDRILGITWVRHDGQIVRAGGRVVKNVAGYDLMKLITGSYGTLGILTQVTCRLYPMPACSQTVVVSGELEPLSRLTANLRNSALTPVALDWLSPALAKHLDLPATYALAAQFQSIAAGVREQVTQLEAMVAAQEGLQRLPVATDREFWRAASTALHGDQPGSPGVLAKLGLQPGAAASFLAQLTNLAPQGLVRLQAGSGLGHLRLPADGLEVGLVESLRSHCHRARGYLTLLVAPPEVKQQMDVWDYQGNALALMGQVKQQFDPERRLNPGRFMGGL